MVLHKVLIPMDGSDFSREILDIVLKFLPPNENSLILLRVGDPPEGHVGHPIRLATAEAPIGMYETARDAEEAYHPIYASQERHSAEAEFQREMQADIRLLEQAGYTVTSHVRFGEPGEEIVSFVETNDVEMVAMTTHWRRGLTRLLFGSVAQYVGRRVTVPVMVLRADDE